MPNWCSTTYNFKGNPDDVTQLHDKIIEWCTDPYKDLNDKKDPYTFNNWWLGNVVAGAGLGTTEIVQSPINQDYLQKKVNAKDLDFRGQITDISDVKKDENSGEFSLYTETAWIPMSKMWGEVIKKLGVDIKFDFMAEEPGCEIFWIYDPNNLGDFEDTVLIDSSGTKELEDINNYYSPGDAVDVLNKFFKTEYKTLEEFDEKINDFNSDPKNQHYFLSVHQFERVDDSSHVLE